MTIQVTRSKFRPGKVVIGPRAIGENFYRIVSLQDRSGRIEAFDPQSRSWAAAPETVTFTDVWKAEPVSQLALDKASTSFSDADDDDVLIDDIDQSTEDREAVH